MFLTFFCTHEIASTALVPQMVDKIKIRFADDIGKPNRITSDTATFGIKRHYGKCSKITNTLKLRTPKIIAENNF